MTDIVLFYGVDCIRGLPRDLPELNFERESLKLATRIGKMV